LVLRSLGRILLIVFCSNTKAPIEVINQRAVHYKRVVQSLLKVVGVSLDKLEFVNGTDYQLSAAYTMDNYRLMTIVTEHDAKKAGSEVVKQIENPTLAGSIYPLMQALDEEYLGVDAQFGGVDQRKIFTLAQEILPKIGYKERIHLMNPMVPGLQAGGKMSASDPDSKIDVLDNPDSVTKKIRKAFAEAKVTEGNGLIAFIEYVLLPISALQNPDGKPTIKFTPREGEPLIYSDVADIRTAYEADTLTPQLLKAGVSDALNSVLAPIQAEFEADKEWQSALEAGYPTGQSDKKKKDKKPKDKGSRYPGVKTNPDGTVEGPGADEVKLGTDVQDVLSKLSVNGS
jgi:tyrosyl-tRNA synthetase